MKRIFAITITIFMILFMFTGCGDKKVAKEEYEGRYIIQSAEVMGMEFYLDVYGGEFEAYMDYDGSQVTTKGTYTYEDDVLALTATSVVTVEDGEETQQDVGDFDAWELNYSDGKLFTDETDGVTVEFIKEK